MRTSRYGAKWALLGAVFLAFSAGAGITAVPVERPDIPKRAFQVLPKDQPRMGLQRRKVFNLAPPVIVRTGQARARLRWGLVRALALIGAGLLAIGLLGYRVYGLQDRFRT